ncbi:unnamed protein product [Cuscuta campestris]|uniref:DUF4283 domain-containing protein n=1 Tax=Cuscuta campestris TaxID=132261 RepID=A0A484KB40_9ASTE|nr:unnamed protein product [Cuscuta campestris]
MWAVLSVAHLDKRSTMLLCHSFGKESSVQGEFKGCPSVSFTPEDIQKLSRRFTNALIGTFARRPAYAILKNFLQKLGLQGGFSIGTLSYNQVLINFQFEEDYERVFLRQTWSVGNHLLVVTKWTTDHTEGIDCPVVPVWVSCPKLPIFLHDQRALSIIASAIGRPLKVDESTLRFSRPELARFCVEIDVSKPPHSKIHINLGGKDLFLQLVYENIPHYCSSCSKLGQLRGHCRNQERELKQPVQIRENKGKEITREKWTVITSKRGGSEAVWKRELGPSSSGPGECSKSYEAQQLQDKDTPVLVIPCPAPATSTPTSALLDPTPPQGPEVVADSEGNNMALVLWKPLPIAESKFSPLLQQEEEYESDESDYEDLGIIPMVGLVMPLADVKNKGVTRGSISLSRTFFVLSLCRSFFAFGRQATAAAGERLAGKSPSATIPLSQPLSPVDVPSAAARRPETVTKEPTPSPIVAWGTTVVVSLFPSDFWFARTIFGKEQL